MSIHPHRRAEIKFSIPYGEDLDRVRRVVSDVLEEDERVRKEPAPIVVVSELEPSYRQMLTRFWVDSDSFLGARWAICEKIDCAFSSQGIRLGVPRIEVVSSDDRRQQEAQQE